MDREDPSGSRNYEIQTLSDDQEYDYEENEEEYEANSPGIIMAMPAVSSSSSQARQRQNEYLDKSELEPTTANMILGFQPSKIIDDIIPTSSSLASSAGTTRYIRREIICCYCYILIKKMKLI